MPRVKGTWLGGMLLAVAGFAAAGVMAQEPAPRKALKVCQDPNNLPFSNVRGEGFENRIAEVLAKDLGLELKYFFFPQRMAFIRNTLRAKDKDARNEYKCDLVMQVPDGFDLTSNTRPYYRSTYAFVYVKGRGLDDIRTQEDLAKLPRERKDKLRIGMFARTPAVDWLLKYDMINQGVPYQLMTGDPEQYPGQVLEKDLVADKVNGAFVWGPIAGYFAHRVKDHELVVIPMRSEPGIQFDFSMAMGVRFGEKEWKKQIQDAVDRNSDKIAAILAEYRVPLVDDKGVPVAQGGSAALSGAKPYQVVGNKVDRSTFLGWRLFHARCADCHGSNATGTSRGPNLLPRVAAMEPGDFVHTVLYRYNLVQGYAEAGADTGRRDAIIAEIMERRQGNLAMPPMEGDANVSAHVMDLYAYLRARADGALGEGRPEQMR